MDLILCMYNIKINHKEKYSCEDMQDRIKIINFDYKYTCVSLYLD